MTVWNTIDDRYSNVVLYKEMKPQFLIFCPFFKAFSQWQSGIISMIDTPIYWYYCGRVNGLAFCKESHLLVGDGFYPSLFIVQYVYTASRNQR